MPIGRDEFRGFGEALGFDADSNDTLEEKRAKKLKSLEYLGYQKLTLGETSDGDTIVGIDADGNEKKLRYSGVDTYESGIQKSSTAKINNQKRAYATKYNVPFESVTVADIKAEGLAGKKRNMELLGAPGEEFWYLPTGEKSKLIDDDRIMSNIVNKYGDDVVEALANQEYDAAYWAPWNRKKRLKEYDLKKKANALAPKPTGFNEKTGEPEAQLAPDGTITYGTYQGLTQTTYGKYKAILDESLRAKTESWAGKVPDRLSGTANAIARTLSGAQDLGYSALEQVVRNAYMGYGSFDQNVEKTKLSNPHLSITDQHVEQFNKYLNADPRKLTPEDMAIMETAEGKALMKAHDKSANRQAIINSIRVKRQQKDKKVNRTTDKILSERFQSNAKNFGTIKAILKSGDDIVSYTPMFFDSLAHTVLLAGGPAISGATMMTLFYDANTRNTEEFVKRNKRDPDAKETVRIAEWSALGAMAEKLEAGWAVKGAGKAMREITRASKELPYGLKYLAVPVSKGGRLASTAVGEFGQEGATALSDEMAVKQDVGEVNWANVAEQATVGMYSSPGMAATFGSINAMQSFSPSGIVKNTTDDVAYYNNLLTKLSDKVGHDGTETAYEGADLKKQTEIKRRRDSAYGKMLKAIYQFEKQGADFTKMNQLYVHAVANRPEDFSGATRIEKRSDALAQLISDTIKKSDAIRSNEEIVPAVAIRKLKRIKKNFDKEKEEIESKYQEVTSSVVGNPRSAFGKKMVGKVNVFSKKYDPTQELKKKRESIDTEDSSIDEVYEFVEHYERTRLEVAELAKISSDTKRSKEVRIAIRDRAKRAKTELEKSTETYNQLKENFSEQISKIRDEGSLKNTELLYSVESSDLSKGLGDIDVEKLSDTEKKIYKLRKKLGDVDVKNIKSGDKTHVRMQVRIGDETETGLDEYLNDIIQAKDKYAASKTATKLNEFVGKLEVKNERFKQAHEIAKQRKADGQTPIVYVRQQDYVVTTEKPTGRGVKFTTFDLTSRKGENQAKSLLRYVADDTQVALDTGVLGQLILQEKIDPDSLINALQAENKSKYEVIDRIFSGAQKLTQADLDALSITPDTPTVNENIRSTVSLNPEQETQAEAEPEAESAEREKEPKKKEKKKKEKSELSKAIDENKRKGETTVSLSSINKRLPSLQESFGADIVVFKKTVNGVTRFRVLDLTDRANPVVIHNMGGKKKSETFTEKRHIFPEIEKLFHSKTAENFLQKNIRRFVNIRKVKGNIAGFFSIGKSKGDTKSIIDENVDTFSVGKIAEYINSKFKELTTSEEVTRDTIAYYAEEFKRAFEEELRSDPKALKGLFDESMGVFPESNISLLYMEDGDTYTLPDEVFYAMAVASINWMHTNASDTLINDEATIAKFIYGSSETYLRDADYKALSSVGSFMYDVAGSIGGEATRILKIKPNSLNSLKAFDEVSELQLMKLLDSENMATSVGHMAIGIMTKANFKPERVRSQRGFRRVYKEKMVEIHRNRVHFDSKEADEDRRFKSGQQITTVVVPTIIKKSFLNSIKYKALHPVVENLKDKLSGQTKFIEEINGTKVNKPGYLLEPNPEEERVTRVRGSNSVLPKRVRKLIETLENEPWVKLTKNILFHEYLGPIYEDLYDITDPESAHVTKQESIESKNTEYYRQLGNLKRFVSETVPEFFFKYNVMNQHRVFIDSNNINPMASKITRFLIVPKNFITEVGKEDYQTRILFKMAVVQAFGIGFDKGTAQQSIDQFEAIIKDSHVVQILELQRKDKLNEYEQYQYRKLFKSLFEQYGGEPTHLLAGLVALSEYRKGGTFETKLGIEVDAVTSGYAISTLQLLGIDPADPNSKQDVIRALNRVGIFFEDDEDYGRFLQQNNDIYEETSLRVHNYFTETTDAEGNRIFSDKQVEALYSLHVKIHEDPEEDDDLRTTFKRVITSEGRKLSKSPFMVSGYGAGIRSVVESVVDLFIGSMYDKMTEIQKIYDAAETDEQRAEMVAKAVNLQDQIESVTGIEIDIPFGTRIKKKAGKNLLSLDLSQEGFNEDPVNEDDRGESYETRISQSAYDLYNGAYTVAMEEVLGPISERRDAIVSAYSFMFSMFNEKYEAALYERRKELGLRDPKKDKSNAHGMPRMARNQVLNSIIAEYMPKIRSFVDEVGEDAFIDMIKYRPSTTGRVHTKMDLGPDTNYTATSAGVVKSQPVVAKGKVVKKKGKLVRDEDGKLVREPVTEEDRKKAAQRQNPLSVSSLSLTTSPTDPGVSAWVRLIQNIDSMMMLNTLEKTPNVLTIYDAVFGSLKDIMKSVDDYGNSLVDINDNYNIAEMTLTLFDEIMDNLKSSENGQTLLRAAENSYLSSAYRPRSIKKQIAKLDNELEEIKRRNKENPEEFPGKTYNRMVKKIQDEIKENERVLETLGMSSIRAELDDVVERINKDKDAIYKNGKLGESVKNNQHFNLPNPEPDPGNSEEITPENQENMEFNEDEFRKEQDKIKESFEPTKVNKETNKAEPGTGTKQKTPDNIKSFLGSMAKLGFPQEIIITIRKGVKSLIYGSGITVNPNTDGIDARNWRKPYKTEDYIVFLDESGDLLLDIGRKVDDLSVDGYSDRNLYTVKSKNRFVLIDRASGLILYSSNTKETLSAFKERVAGLEQEKVSEKYFSIDEKVHSTIRNIFSGKSLANTAEAVFGKMTEIWQHTGKDTLEHITHQEHLEHVFKTLIMRGVNTVDDVKLTVNEIGEFARGMIDRQTKEVTMNYNSNSPQSYSEQTPQEVYTHELMHNTLDFAFQNVPEFRTLAIELFTEIRDRGVITPESFMKKKDGKVVFLTSETAERKAAQRQYDRIFGGDVSFEVGVIEFMTYGLTNMWLVPALKKEKPTLKETLKDIAEGDSWYSKLYSVVSYGLDKVKDVLHGTKKKESVYEQLYDLADFYTTIGEKRRDDIFLYERRKDSIEKVNQWETKLSKFIKKYGKISLNFVGDKYINGVDYFTDHGRKTSFVAGAMKSSKLLILPISSAGSHALRSPTFMNAMANVYSTAENIGYSQDELKGARIVGKLFQNAADIALSFGSTIDAAMLKFLDKSKKDIDTQRYERKQVVEAYLLNSFATNPTADEAASMFRGFLKTGFHTLVENNDFSMRDATRLLSDDAFLKREISTYMRNMNIRRNSYYYKRADQLALFMTEGRSTKSNTFRNVQDITANVPSAQDNALVDEPQLDILITLMAIDKLTADTKKITSEIIKKEFAVNSQDNGITRLVHFIISHKDTVLKNEYGGEKSSLRKGFFSKTFNSHSSVVVGNMKDSELMESAGYNYNEMLEDFSYASGLGLFIATNVSPPTRTKGIISNTSLKEFVINLKSMIFANTTKSHGGNLWKRFVKDHKDNMITDTVQFENAPIPITNDTGRIVDYELSVPHSTLEQEAGLETDVFKILAHMASRHIDVTESVKINTEIVDELVRRQDVMYEDNEYKFIDLLDGIYYEDYFKKIPSYVQAYIRKKAIRGRGRKRHFYVERNMLNTIFAYKNPSVGGIFNVEQNYDKERVISDDSIIQTTKAKAGLVARRIEEVVVELVSIATTNIVIKLPPVWLANKYGNYVTSLLSGVPIDFQVKYMNEALQDLIKYKELSSELAQLDLTLETTPSERTKKNKKKRAELVYRMNNSPLAKFMDAGVYNAITEESNTGDLYYVDKLMENVVGATKDVVGASALGAIAKQLWLTKETAYYKASRNIVQVSDFMARYALYKHQTEVQGMSEAVAWTNMQELFVNYNVPLNRYINWTNSVGMMLFMKYATGTMRASVKLAFQKPARVISYLAAQSLLEMDIPSVLDSRFLHFEAPIWGFYRVPEKLIIPPGIDAPLETFNMLTGTYSEGSLTDVTDFIESFIGD